MNRQRLMDELKQTKPFDPPELEAYFNLVKTEELLSGALAAEFKQAGLSAAQYNVLRILAGAGKEGRQCHEISERLLTRVPDVTRLIDRLKEKGLVDRIRSDRDRRVVHVVITDEGRALVKRLEQPVARIHNSLLGHLNQKEQDALNALLYKIRYNNRLKNY